MAGVYRVITPAGDAVLSEQDYQLLREALLDSRAMSRHLGEPLRAERVTQVYDRLPVVTRG